jgi:hypothetical protein
MKLTRCAHKGHILRREATSPLPEKGYGLWQERASAPFEWWPQAYLQLLPCLPRDPVRKRAVSSSPRRLPGRTGREPPPA